MALEDVVSSDAGDLAHRRRSAIPTRRCGGWSSGLLEDLGDGRAAPASDRRARRSGRDCARRRRGRLARAPRRRRRPRRCSARWGTPTRSCGGPCSSRLRELRDPRAAEPLIAALEDPVADVRREAVVTLAYLRHPGRHPGARPARSATRTRGCAAWPLGALGFLSRPGAAAVASSARSARRTGRSAPRRPSCSAGPRSGRRVPSLLEALDGSVVAGAQGGGRWRSDGCARRRPCRRCCVSSRRPCPTCGGWRRRGALGELRRAPRPTPLERAAPDRRRRRGEEDRRTGSGGHREECSEDDRTMLKGTLARIARDAVARWRGATAATSATPPAETIRIAVGTQDTTINCATGGPHHPRAEAAREVPAPRRQVQGRHTTTSPGRTSPPARR